MVSGCQKQQVATCTNDNRPVVYFTQEISSQSLIKVYQQLGVTPTGTVAIKVSTGEPGGHNFLNPQMVKPLVDLVHGTIVECNTAYAGRRNTTEEHWKAIKEHGWLDIAPVDLMDEEGDMNLPVRDTTYIKYDIVGNHLTRYNYMINLAHFKGHVMGGFGGVLKNQSIGVASSRGKAYIHSAGYTTDQIETWNHTAKQDVFLECMAVSAQAVQDYFATKGENRILYINVMNNLSVDCDCDSHPHDPEMRNIGILASLDPVAVDQACIDLVFNYPSTNDDNAKALIERINSRHGVHTIEKATELGMGSREYNLVSIDGEEMLETLNKNHYSLVVRSHGEQTTYSKKGVRDLWDLQSTRVLQGAAVADKIIGTGAAFLMMNGGAKYITTNTISKDALSLLREAQIEVKYDTLVDTIENNAKTGECPLELKLKGVTTLEKAMPLIEEFVKQLPE